MLSIVVSTISFAQLQPSFGIRAGLSSASIRGASIDNLKNLLDFTNGMVTTNNRTGFFAGGYANIPVSDMISVEPGIYYTQKGYGMKGALNVKGLDFLNANAKAQLQSAYIDIPLLLKANINGFQIFAGPQASYLLNADLLTTAGVLGFNVVNSKMDATSQFNRWDMAVTGGIGYTFANGINLTAAYDHGLSKADANKNFSSYNNAIKIGIGISF